MPVIFDCPGCGTRSTFDRLRQTADEFCRQCDYPLFWATPAVIEDVEPEPESDEDALERTLRRRPGVAGRQVALGTPCPSCGEKNTVVAEFCIRCGEPMHPLPPPPPPEPQQPLPPPQPMQEPSRNWFPWIMGGLLILLVITLIVFFAVR